MHLCILLGFVGEMRECAMKLHTKDQATEGKQQTKSTPFTKVLKYNLQESILMNNNTANPVPL